MNGLAFTSSWANNAITASYISASNISGTVLSASYAATASYVVTALTASFVTASNIVGTVTSASYAATASYVVTALTASFVTASNIAGIVTSASYAATASYANSGFIIGISQIKTNTVASSINGSNNIFNDIIYDLYEPS